MKLDTSIVLAKCGCYVLIGFFTPLTVGLAQWANTGDWPPRIIWVIMGASCCVGAASQLLSFLSGSYSDYLTKRTGNGNTDMFKNLQPPTKPPGSP